MGAHGSKEKLSRSSSERYTTHNQVIDRERFGSFVKRSRAGKLSFSFWFWPFVLLFDLIYNFALKLSIWLSSSSVSQYPPWRSERATHKLRMKRRIWQTMNRIPYKCYLNLSSFQPIHLIINPMYVSFPSEVSLLPAALITNSSK